MAVFGSGVKASAHEAGGDERRGLGAMNVFQHLGGGRGVFGFEVDDLGSDHGVDGSSAAGNLLDDAHPRFGGTFQLGENFVGLSLQRVPGEDGKGFAEYFVASWTAATQVVVIESRQI